jgi:hypothetical protein
VLDTDSLTVAFASSAKIAPAKRATRLADETTPAASKSFRQ